MRVLVLGGTGEGRALATRLAAERVDVVSSLAGQVASPLLPPGEVRVGAFAGADELADWLRTERVERVVDATHPFAATVTRHAVDACARVGVPLLVLRRPAWAPAAGDDWQQVPDVPAAAAAVRARPAGAVLLTTGRRDLAAFAGDDVHHFVVRLIEAPSQPLPPHSTILLERGPYDLEHETALLRRHDVAVLVTKNSGGPQTAAKLVAARRLGVPVVVVDRPALPPTRTVEDVSDAVAWALGEAGRASAG